MRETRELDYVRLRLPEGQAADGWPIARLTVEGGATYSWPPVFCGYLRTQRWWSREEKAGAVASR